jgi:hypothetical protein
MQIVFMGAVPKEFEYPDNNEDAFSINNTVVTVSDGASESFDAKTWARILVHKYVNIAQFNESWFVAAIDEYSRSHNRDELSWAKQASFDRGSFATLLGIEYHEESNSVRVLALGDSLAVLISNRCLERSYPYTSSEDFNQNPTLLSTNRPDNDFVNKQDFFSTHTVTWDLQPLEKPFVLCMTDALGQWFLKTYPLDPTILESLLSFRSESEMQEFIAALRRDKAIRTDDTTLLVIDLNGTMR